MKLAVMSVIICLVIFSVKNYAADDLRHHKPEHISAVESLSPPLRELLRKEMLALQQGMMSVIPAYVSANWSEIESIADNMKNSYILKQSLSDEQEKELHSTLPGSFIILDNKFHYLSGMLNHAAKNKKAELVGFYYSKLSESCVDCHSQFARHKFPGFTSETAPHQHGH